MNKESTLIAPGLTPAEYARKHDVTLDWVYRLCRIGRLPHERVFRRLFIVGNEGKKAPAQRAQ